MPQKNKFKHGKLAETLRFLNEAELKSFVKWIQSPWANSNKKLAELLIFLKGYYPIFEHPDLSKENIFSVLYPDKPFNDRWLRNILAALNKQAEAFLIHQQLEKEETTRAKLLAKVYEEKHQPQRLIKLSKTINSNLAAQPAKSLEQLYLGNFINELIYYLPESNIKQKDKKQRLQLANDYLSQFFLLGKWRYQTELISRTKLIGEEYKDLLQEDFLDQIPLSKPIEAIGIFRSYQKLFEALSIENYKELEHRFFENFEAISEADRRTIYYYLLNSQIRAHRQNIEGISFKQIFEFYLKGIEKQILLINGRISQRTFSNIVNGGMMANKSNEVYNFILEYCHFIKPSSREDAKTWALAYYYFYLNQFDKCIQLLAPHKFKTFNFDVRTRLIQARVFHLLTPQDNNYSFILKDYCKAFDQFIRRSKSIAQPIKKSYLNFNHTLIKLNQFAFSNPIKKSKLLALTKKITNENIQCKQWLINEIKKHN